MGRGQVVSEETRHKSLVDSFEELNFSQGHGKALWWVCAGEPPGSFLFTKFSSGSCIAVKKNVQGPF